MRRLPSVLLALCVLALAACGGEDTMSPDEYRAEAREICRDADRATETVDAPTRSTSEAIADYFRRLLEANERATRRFQDLDPPDELRSAHEDALSTNRAGVQEVRRVIQQLEGGGDPREVLTGAQSRLQDLSRQAGEAAERLGVPECGDTGGGEAEQDEDEDPNGG
jgi:hypothetical protein